MDKREEAKTDMCRSVRNMRTATTATAAAIATIPVLNDAFDAHAADITILEALDLARAGAATGGGAAKTVGRTQAEEAFLEVDGILTAYAAVTGDADLLSKVNKERSTLTRLSDEDLRVHGAFLLGKCGETGMLAALGTYGLSPTKLEFYTARYNTFYALINLPDERAQAESTYVQLIDAKIAAMDRRLDLIMDKLMRQLKTTHLEIWTRYKEARVINEGGGGGGGGGTGGGGGGNGGGTGTLIPLHISSVVSGTGSGGSEVTVTFDNEPDPNSVTNELQSRVQGTTDWTSVPATPPTQTLTGFPSAVTIELRTRTVDAQGHEFFSDITTGGT